VGVSASSRKGLGEGTPEGLLTPEEVMAYLKCGRSHAFSLLRTREIPSLKVGRLRRIRREDLDAYVASRLEESP
jgi:excisionase family DNA binding protein